MKKTLVYGIIVFFVGSFMIGCGSDKKSAAAPTPAATPNNVTNVTNYFTGTPPTSTLNLVGRTGTVVNSSAFDAIFGVNSGSGANFFNGTTSTGNSFLDQSLNCAGAQIITTGVTFGLNWLLNQIGGTNTQANSSGTCIVGGTNTQGLTGTQGLVVQNGTTFQFNADISSSTIRGSIIIGGVSRGFDASRTHADRFYDANRNLLITVNPSNSSQLRLWNAISSTATNPTPAAYISL